MKTLILLLCFGLLIPCRGKADVDAVYFQMNLNGEVVDIGSTGTDPSDFSDLLEDIQTEDISEQSGINEDIEQEEQESVVPVRSVSDQSSVTCSFDNSGVTEGGCVCPADGSDIVQLVQASDNKYVCCNMVTHKIYRGGSYSKEFMPWCGCLDSSYRAPFVSTDQLCCKNGKYWYNTINDNGEPTGVSDGRCGCPSNSTEVMNGSVQHCCRRLQDLTTTEGGPNNPEVCGCVAGDDTHCNKTLCANTAGHQWCSIGTTGGWCTPEASCQTECTNKGGHWCAKDNQCVGPCDEIGQTWDAATCECQNGCSAAHLEACGETNCQENGGYLCYVEGGTEENPVQACQATTCCPADQQQGTDGNCYPCPAEGSVLFVQGEYFCCKQDRLGQAYMIYDSSGRWYAKADCGCPDGGTFKEDGGVCCSNGYAYNGTSYSLTGYFDVCGCPDGGIFNEESGVCCQGGYPFDSENKQYSETEDMESCGCSDSKVLDTSSNQCVTCLEDSDCGSGKYCLIDTSDSSKNTCVACLTYEHCGENKICNTKHQCASCSEETHYSEGKCYGCTKDDDCSGGYYCDSSERVCVSCKPNVKKDLTDWTKDYGCKTSAPYCVQTSEGRHCSECWINQNCPADRPICNATAGICQARCVADGDCAGDTPKCNRNTGECVAADDTWECSGVNSVWNIYEKRCVHCYDSISSNWTDLGCPDDESSASSLATYSTRGFVNTEKRNRICLVNRFYPDGKCVECLMDSHCPEGRGCVDYMCACDEGKTYDSALKQCVECNANYGVKGDNKIACSKKKPSCNLQNHVCEACADKKVYNTALHQCVSCLESQCMEVDSTTGNFTCFNLADWDDVTKDASGMCKKKNITKKYEITGCVCSLDGANCVDEIRGCSWADKYDSQGRDIKDYKLSSKKFRFKYEHSVTVKTDSADDCVYGSNLTGELTSVDSDSEAQPCKHYMRANGNGDAQMDKKFKATAKVAPGKYSGVHLKIKDIWCSGIGIRNGSGSIQFNN